MTELFQQFQDFRKILCVCPCCGDIVRISDLKLKIRGRTNWTWRDKFDNDTSEMERQEKKFEELEKELREVAHVRGRKSAQVIFNKAISPALKKMKYDPFDIKPVFYPIDYIVFKGMNGKGSIEELILLSRQSNSTMLNSIRNKIDIAVENEKYDWQEVKIEETGKIVFK